MKVFFNYLFIYLFMFAIFWGESSFLFPRIIDHCMIGKYSMQHIQPDIRKWDKSINPKNLVHQVAMWENMVIKLNKTMIF